MPRHFGYDSHTEGGWTWENHTNSEVSKRLIFFHVIKIKMQLNLRHDDIMDYILNTFFDRLQSTRSQVGHGMWSFCKNIVQELLLTRSAYAEIQ